MKAGRNEICAYLAGFYTCKMRGKVWACWDGQKRAYLIRGDNLPAHPDLVALYPNGWSMLDYIKPAQARAMFNGEVQSC